MANNTELDPSTVPCPPVPREVVEVFDRMLARDGTFGLISCTVNGEETTAIVELTADPREAGHFLIWPIFVAVTPSMRLRGPEGAPTEPAANVFGQTH